MKKIITLTLLTLLAACGADTSSLPGAAGGSTSSGSNTTTLDTTNIANIVFTTTTQDVGASATYYAVSALVDDAAGNTVIHHNANYPGTVTTTCVQAAVFTTTAKYDCTTVYNLTTPFGNPKPVTQTVTFNLGQAYRVYQKQNRLTASAVITEVGTITIP